MKGEEISITVEIPRKLHRHYTNYCDDIGIKYKKFIQQALQEKLERLTT